MANSSYDMLERYLEQQVAVYSALIEKALKKNKDINTLPDQDVSLVEDLIAVLKPLKTVTLSTESTPSVSMILPLKTTVLNSVKPNEEDSPNCERSQGCHQRKPDGKVLHFLS